MGRNGLAWLSTAALLALADPAQAARDENQECTESEGGSSVIEYDRLSMSPLASCGDLAVHRTRDGEILETWPINCSPMGLGSVADDGTIYEVVASNGLSQFSQGLADRNDVWRRKKGIVGGPELPQPGLPATSDDRTVRPVTCGKCSIFRPLVPGLAPPPQLKSAGYIMTSYPTIVIVLGNTGSQASNWYLGSQAPAPGSSQYTSYCADDTPAWGLLTNPQGHSKDFAVGGYSAWGGFAFQQYDWINGHMAVANVDANGTLVPASVADTCH